MNSIAETAVRLLEHGRTFALATIVSRQGSTPRTAGARMIVTADGGIVGTIGGGLVEARVIRKAMEVIASGRPVMVPFEMTASELASMDMVCGGRLEVLVEAIRPGSPAAEVVAAWRDLLRTRRAGLFLTVLEVSGGGVEAVGHMTVRDGRVERGEARLPPGAMADIVRDAADAGGLRTVPLGETLVLVEPVLPAETVHLFGAGHVSRAAARLAALVGFRLEVVDDREEFANAARFPDADAVRVVPDFDAAVNGAAMGGGDYVVIATRGHLHDRTVLAQALGTGAGYIGMIGSRRKRDHLYAALREQGFTDADFARVSCPIGLDIGAETPEEIGVSIVAELIRHRARGRRP